jgi:ribosomal protein S1
LLPAVALQVGDKLRAVVLSQGLDMQRLILTIKGLEKEPGELLQLNSEQRDEFFRQAEARAAAGYSNIIGGASA